MTTAPHPSPHRSEGRLSGLPQAREPDASVRSVRRAGHVEGASLLVLMLVAMPLKYLAGFPLAVTIVGWIHGALFLWFCAVLAHAFFTQRWRFVPTSALLVLAVVPFGFVIADRLLADPENLRRSTSDREG